MFKKGNIPWNKKIVSCIEMVCYNCNSNFSPNKNQLNKYCSRQCSNKHTASKRAMSLKGKMLGENNPMYGKKHSKESKLQMSVNSSYEKIQRCEIVCIGCQDIFFDLPRNKDIRKYCSKTCMIKNLFVGNVLGKLNKGIVRTDEQKALMSRNRKGINTLEKNPNWHGGKSFEPYGVKFNNSLKEKLRKKYNYRCQECFRHQDELYNDGKKYKLDIHHINYNKQNNSEHNLIPLCKSCHMQTNFQREQWIDYYKDKVVI